METIIFSRIAMAGWIFLAVLVGSLWSTNSTAWQVLLGLLQPRENSSLVLGLAGLIIGIGAPPALGFLIERVVTIILISLKRSITVYPRVAGFKDTLRLSLNEQFNAVSKNVTGPATFHVFFYTSADKELLNWARRRLAQVYASATGVIAILSALVIGGYIAGSFNWRFIVISLAFAVLLFNDARIQSNSHRDTICAWVETFPLSASFSRKHTAGHED